LRGRPLFRARSGDFNDAFVALLNVGVLYRCVEDRGGAFRIFRQPFYAP
jgi:hypothetical protein